MSTTRPMPMKAMLLIQRIYFETGNLIRIIFCIKFLILISNVYGKPIGILNVSIVAH